jgi:hypothetical protein
MSTGNCQLQCYPETTLREIAGTLLEAIPSSSHQIALPQRVLIGIAGLASRRLHEASQICDCFHTSPAWTQPSIVDQAPHQTWSGKMEEAACNALLSLDFMVMPNQGGHGKDLKD